MKILDQNAVKYFESLQKENINQYGLKNSNERRIDFLQLFIDAADQGKSLLTSNYYYEIYIYYINGNKNLSNSLYFDII